jgi:prefoldin alpha subunit
MAKEQYLYQLAMLEQEANKFQEQMQLLDQQILEIQSIQRCLDELEHSKEKEIYANLGKNIFIKTELKEKNLLVDVGNKTFVRKSISDTSKIVDEQVYKIAEAKGKIVEKLQELQQEMEKIIVEAEKADKEI